MGRRGDKAARIRASRPPTIARETLERQWFPRMRRGDTQLSHLVTAQGGDHEPFHRWLHYRQGFSPGLVRLYLQETGTPPRGLPIVDPFAGAATTVIECARLHQPVIGLEVSSAMAFLANARFGGAFPPVPGGTPLDHWSQVAPLLDHPLHHAALMFAEARRLTAEGRANKSAPPLAQVFADAQEMMSRDLRIPLPALARVLVADARMMPLENASVGGVLTSPPYVSRYDYGRIQSPLEQLYRYWYATASRKPVDSVAESRGSGGQLPAGTRRPRRDAQGMGRGSELGDIGEAGLEAIAELEAIGEPRMAGVVRGYLLGMWCSLREMARVVAPGGCAWMVVGGARVKGVYLPADLILAEMSKSVGFDVGDLLIARKWVDSGRRMGDLYGVSPRESIVCMVRT